MPEAKQENNKVRKILVVGGAGYIGSVLVRKLLDKGYSVRVLDALIYEINPIDNLLGNSNFEFIKGDFRNIETVIHNMQGIDAVIHLGALVGVPVVRGDNSDGIIQQLQKIHSKTNILSGIHTSLRGKSCHGAGHDAARCGSLPIPVSAVNGCKRHRGIIADIH